MADGALEENRVLAQRIESRRLDALVTVGRQMVGAQRVDGDQDDLRARGKERDSRFARRPSPATGQREKNQEERGNPSGHSRVQGGSIAKTIGAPKPPR